MTDPIATGQKNQINWQPIIEIGIVVAAVFGTTVPLYLHTDNKLHAALTEIKAETKDFHGRLIAIEEKIKKND